MHVLKPMQKQVKKYFSSIDPIYLFSHKMCICSVAIQYANEIQFSSVCEKFQSNIPGNEQLFE